MYSDLIEENHKLQPRIMDLENAITHHAQTIRNVGISEPDKLLWNSIGLYVYTDAEKEALDKEALRMETEAQKRGEGAI